MSVSRKGNGDEDYEFTEKDYMEDKRMCQDRSGYPEVSDEQLAQTAVDEKLPSGSQSY